MSIQILDPTHENDFQAFSLAPRLSQVSGATVGLISNGKEGTKPFFDAMETALRERHGVRDVIRVTKPNYSAPAGDDIFANAKDWDALIAGIGD